MDQASSRKSEAEERIGASRSVQRLLAAVLDDIGAGAGELAPVLEAAPEALVAFDADRRILSANTRAEAMFGFGRGELDGRSTDVLIPERYRQPDAPPMAATVAVVHVELPGLFRDGTERLVEWCFGSVSRDGRLVFVMTVRDRLALDRAIEALRESERRFQLFVNGVRDCAIYMMDADGCVSSWNAGAARVKGWSAEEVIGKPFEVFFTPDDRRAGVPARLLAAAARDGGHETTGWRVRRDGTRFWMEGSLTALRGPGGEISGYAKITRDLTERVRAEENERRLIAERAAREAAQEAEQRLRASEDRLVRLHRMTAALSEAVTLDEVADVFLRDCVDAVDAAGGALYVLASDQAHLELVGQRGHPEETERTYGRLHLEASTPLTDAARRRAPAFYESYEECLAQYPSLREAMAAGDLEASVALPLVAHGALRGVLGVRWDRRRTFGPPDRSLLLTMADLCSQALERATLFDAECAARGVAEAASRAKDEFLAMLGHELRNPLAPITTALFLLKRRGGASGELAIIERQVGHVARLVDDLLDVSRITTGKIELRRERVEVSTVVARALETVSPLLEQRAHAIELDVALEGLPIMGDVDRLAQVVSNLVTNAAKYSDAGAPIRVSASRAGDRARIEVVDRGIGIAPDMFDRIFDLFFQQPQALDRARGGLGLGLAIVKSLVTMHGGVVSVTSDGPGTGSRFVVELPLAPAAERSAPLHREGPQLPEGLEPGKGGKRVLVVDDNEDAAEVMSEMLRALGHEVEIAHDGPRALDVAGAFEPTICLLDLGLPIMDGYELAQRLKADTRRPVRLIAVTGYGQEADRVRSREAGFDAHLVKPVDPQLLMKLVALA